MSEFKSDPLLVLKDESDLLHYLKDNPRDGQKYIGADGIDQWSIKSLFIIQIIDEIVASGAYPYNSTVQTEVEKQLGLPFHKDGSEGSMLSLLVYNAQGYRRSDKLRADGYEPFTPDMIDRAFVAKSKIELLADGIIFNKVKVLLNIREINGKRYAMQPKKRIKYIPAHGQPARMVTA